MSSSVERAPLDPRAAHGAHPNAPMILDDADGDIAALVYSRFDRPDIVLCDFAARLRDEGRRVCGMIQLRDREAGEPFHTVLTLNDWHVFDVAHRAPDEEARRCHIDARLLDQMARRVESEVARGVDAVVASRFGPLELAGRGFFRVVRLASEARTPLVIAVPASAFEGWTRVSGGMAVRLGCRLEDVLGWWYSLTRPCGDAGRPRVCELVK